VHEIGLSEGIVEAVLRRAGDRTVTGAVVRAGVRQRIVPDLMRQAFAMVAAGTVAEAAVLDVQVVPVSVGCRACGQVRESLDHLAACSVCGSEDVDISCGDELTLVSVTVRPGGAAQADDANHADGANEAGRPSLSAPPARV
jgi:hydrogenase nickel incorporation protein HypA/HybF